MSGRAKRGSESTGVEGGSSRQLWRSKGHGQERIHSRDEEGFGSSDSSLLHDRVKLVLLNMLGHTVEVKLKSGKLVSGIFSGMTEEEDFGIILEMAHENSSPRLPFIHTMVIKGDDLVQLEATNMELSSSTQEKEGSFRVDGEIASRRAAPFAKEKELQRWVPDGDSVAPHTDLSLSGSSEKWDQFEANHRLFGVTSTWDMNLYTTKLDLNKYSEEEERRAAEIAVQIQQESVAREYSHTDQGLDEEDLHSAVLPEMKGSSSRASLEGKRTSEEQVAPKVEKVDSGSESGISLPEGNTEVVSSPTPSVDEEETKENKKHEDATTVAAALPSMPQIKTLGGVFSISNLNPEVKAWTPPTSADGPSSSTVSAAPTPGASDDPVETQPSSTPSLGDIKGPLSEIYHQAALHMQRNGPSNHKQLDHKWPGSLHGHKHQDMLEDDVYAVPSVHNADSSSHGAVTTSTGVPMDNFSVPAVVDGGLAPPGAMVSPGQNLAVGSMNRMGVVPGGQNQLQLPGQSLLAQQPGGQVAPHMSGPGVPFGVGQAGMQYLSGSGRGQVPQMNSPMTPGGLLPMANSGGLVMGTPSPHTMAMLQQQQRTGGGMVNPAMVAQAQMAIQAGVQTQPGYQPYGGSVISPAQDVRFVPPTVPGVPLNAGLGMAGVPQGGISGRGMGHTRPGVGRGVSGSPNASQSTNSGPGSKALAVGPVGQGIARGRGQGPVLGGATYASAVSAPRARGRGRAAVPIVRPAGRGVSDVASKTSVSPLKTQPTTGIGPAPHSKGTL